MTAPGSPEAWSRERLPANRACDPDLVEPKRERTLYELSSSLFAGVVIAFAVGGMLVVGLGAAGPLSPEFGICALFLLLGCGRLYLGLERGNEGADDDPHN